MAGIGAFVDFVFILLHVRKLFFQEIKMIQFLGPSDGSALIVPWHGFRPNYLSSNETFFDSLQNNFDFENIL